MSGWRPGRPGRRRTRPSRPRSLAANAASLFGGRLAVAVLGWTGTLMIVHRLSVSDWGRYSFVFSFLGLLTVVSNVVNPRVVVRGLLEGRTDLAGTYVSLRFGLGLVAYGLAMAFVSLAGYPASVVAGTAIAGLSVIIGNTSTGYDIVYQVRLRLSQVAMAGVLGQAGQLGLVIVLIFSANRSLVVFTIPAVLCELIVFSWKRRHLPPGFVKGYSVLRDQWLLMLRYSLPLAIGGALGTIYYNLDTVMLSKLSTFKAVGIYGISYKFAGILAFFPGSVSPALFPLLVKHWPDDAEQFRRLLERTVRLFLVVGALVVVEFSLFARQAITLLYGHAYAVGAGAARFVVASECLGFFTSLAVLVFVSINRNRLYPLAALAGLTLNFGLNLWLIPRWSYRGAAWATLITEVAVAAILWLLLLRATSARVVPGGVVLKVSVASGLAAGASLGCLMLAPWPVSAGAGVLAYGSSLYLTRIGGSDGLRSLIRLEDESGANSAPA